jgi:hypothetical protein
MHATTVYEVIALKSPKEADHLFKSDRFWTKKWQLEFCHLEEVVSGERIILLWTTTYAGNGSSATSRR